MLKPPFEKASHDDADVLRRAILDGLFSVKENLSDVVIFFEEMGYDPCEIDFLDTHSGGTLKTVYGTINKARANPGDLCLFCAGAILGTKNFQPGEALVGTYASKRDARLMPKITIPYTMKPAHELHDAVFRALNIIDAEPNAFRLPYTARLNLVSRACGFSDWHAAEASGRGLIDKMRSALRRKTA